LKLKKYNFWQNDLNAGFTTIFNGAPVITTIVQSALSRTTASSLSLGQVLGAFIKLVILAVVPESPEVRDAFAASTLEDFMSSFLDENSA
jgi:hypothetical protein